MTIAVATPTATNSRRRGATRLRSTRRARARRRFAAMNVRTVAMPGFNHGHGASVRFEEVL